VRVCVCVSVTGPVGGAASGEKEDEEGYL